MENKIHTIIKEKGLKISYVLGKVGLAKSSFYDIMNGKSIPSLANARRICEVLERNLNDVFPEEFKKEDIL
ncbi:helix-turn-helix transcriptional regulator [Clostridium botulinum]|uniref:Helix-turn-helix transcriptional regulator n=1 Tax=Clostridium botulinum TaxID=1491 RepID=A0A6M0V7U2_CLOBO|nr:helix-turn-helix transcriptional regulator [Clostridium botulinum]MBN1070463.1 XRE family transcriptional regulator [Clostridium botulinum]NFE59142.1 helix-turn-helix transcriptional regulator [Clostridium botulinum]NFE84575.1 helix-turn-helix transcriptional regulator [Clostridium botulinum]NFF88507.1 helix-turn-helix transcriptional regulator [Clostridium botulinum]NFG10882.1 helix-turn-helix transcriptional regulator [Clostridium botulinum]